MEVFNLIITFKDSSILKIVDASNYSITDDKVLKVVKNGYHIFVNFDEVRYIGRTIDLDQ